MSANLHATYSASGSKRWLSCPGSIALSRGIPEQPASRYALEGTKAHEALEFLIKNRKNPGQAIRFLREKYPEPLIIHAEMALRYIEKRLKSLPGAELHSEIRCDLPVSEKDQFGTTDVAIIDHFGKLIIIDYKYGAGIPVPASENSQLLYYALGVAHKFDYNFSEVELIVIQPRAQIDGEFIRSWSTTVDYLIEWREKFEHGIRLCKEAEERGPEKYLLSGDHCRFCPAKVSCPEIKNKAFRAAQIAFSDDKGITKVVSPVKLNLAVALPAIEKLEKWIEGVREYAELFMMDGGKINGYKVVEKRGQRKWINPEAASRLARKAYGEKAFAPSEILSPAQFEKALPKAASFLADFAATISSGLTIAPSGDSRPEVKIKKGGKSYEEVNSLKPKKKLSRK